jgi:DNA-binding NarL/FixJ family response regulator
MLVLIADSSQFVAQATERLIKQINPNIVTRHFKDSERLISFALENEGVECVIMDTQLQDIGGSAAVNLVKHNLVNTPVIVFTATKVAATEEVTFINKDDKVSKITEEFAAILSNQTDEIGLATSEPVKLSKRQKQLFGFLAQGMSNKDIAKELGISEPTVKVHFWRLFRRIEVTSRTQALAWARKRGITD